MVDPGFISHMSNFAHIFLAYFGHNISPGSFPPFLTLFMPLSCPRKFGFNLGNFPLFFPMFVFHGVIYVLALCLIGTKDMVKGRKQPLILASLLVFLRDSFYILTRTSAPMAGHNNFLRCLHSALRPPKT